MVKADSDKYKNMLKEVRKLCEKLNDIIDDDMEFVAFKWIFEN